VEDQKVFQQGRVIADLNLVDHAMKKPIVNLFVLPGAGGRVKTHGNSPVKVQVQQGGDGNFLIILVPETHPRANDR
jgi:hypothetical protein